MCEKQICRFDGQAKRKALPELDRKGLSAMMWYCLNKQRICPYRFRLTGACRPYDPSKKKGDLKMRKRNCRVEVCFTKDELTVLSKKAKKAGLSIGGFVRRSVADKEIKEAPPADIPLLLRAMRQAGYNLNQILKRFNTTNVPDMPQFRKGLEEIRAATKMVSDAYTSDYQ